MSVLKMESYYWSVFNYSCNVVVLHNTVSSSGSVSWFGHIRNVETVWGMVMWLTASGSLWLVQKNRYLYIFFITDEMERGVGVREKCYCIAGMLQTHPHLNLYIVPY